jgi:DNA-binding transcriptional MerR regulator
MNNLKSIKILCKELNVSPRTLRYYEQEGIIISYQKTPTSTRQYDVENIDKIKKIIFLRNLGMSISDIKEIFNESSGIQEAVFKRRALLGSELRKIREKYLLLTKTISYLHEGKDIFELNEPEDIPQYTETEDDLVLINKARESAEYMINGEYEKSKKDFGEKLIDVDISVLEDGWHDIVKGIGDFVRIEKIVKKGINIYVYIKYTELYIELRYISRDGNLFAGVWADWILFEDMLNE